MFLAFTDKWYMTDTPICAVFKKETGLSGFISKDRLRFILNRLRDRLWVKPLVACLLSAGAVFVAEVADDTGLSDVLPEIAVESVEKLLTIMANSMLVIATFSVGAMVSAYASASSTATPRSFTLVVADGSSQNALSTFVGAFIFSVVALTVVMNHYFGQVGLFILFVQTLLVFAIVIFTFVRWVDRIARLGRMGSTIDKVEEATARALKRRAQQPNLGGLPVQSDLKGKPVYSDCVGYVQQVDLSVLQDWAEENEGRVVIEALPGTFMTPDRPLARFRAKSDADESNCKCVANAFKIGDSRLFDDDPRFGLAVLSEIAGRALSPAVNDPGTAIDVLGTLVRLFTQWHQTKKEKSEPDYDRVEVPGISVREMFDDAFTAVSRDGAGTVEVAVRLQKALNSLAALDNREVQKAANYHADLALERARLAMNLQQDLEAVRAIAKKHKV